MSDRPVFIVGFTQSGTSLVERLVASHPLVAAGRTGRDPQSHPVVEWHLSGLRRVAAP